MNTSSIRKEGGFALIMVMLILFVLTILVINAVRGSIMNEQMAGGYMDRNRAMQAAEQALRVGEARLMTLNADNDPICLDGCDVINGVATTPAAVPTGSASLPGTWDTGGNQTDFTIPTFNADGTPDTTKSLTASYKIILLADALMPAGKVSANCKAYSLMGRGVGLDSRTVAVLQTIVYACPA